MLVWGEKGTFKKEALYTLESIQLLHKYSIKMT